MDIFPAQDILDQMSWISLLILMYFYGSILYNASCRIADGSEMMLLLYGAGVVGGLIIPILGAIPDGAIIFISGLGGSTLAETQKNLSVGVGTLAGSTIMLITIPWSLSVYLGRRDIENGEAAIERDGSKIRAKYTGFTWTHTGVTTFKEIPSMAKGMMITSMLYLFIQIPALFFHTDRNASSEEKDYAEFGLFATVLAFIVYSVYTLRSAKNAEVVEQRQRAGARATWKKNLGRHFPAGKSLELVFNKFDMNGDGWIDRAELVNCLKSLGLDANRQEVNDIMNEIDQGDFIGDGAGDMKISLHEFERFFTRVLEVHRHLSVSERSESLSVSRASVQLRASQINMHPAATDRLLDHNAKNNANNNAWQSEDCEEDEESFDELTDKALLRKALGQLFLGAILVTVFSDPMVTTINAFATKVGINAFYVSFVVTPLASNASEVVAALVFASKRNNSGISLAFGALYGAGTMNNTFTLAIFLAIIVFRGLQWAYTAEVVATVAVTMIVGLFGLNKTIRIWQAAVVVTLYPLSLLFVAALKAAGVDSMATSN